MQENKREVRAVSTEYGRQYYAINYRLSLTGKELLLEHLAKPLNLNDSSPNGGGFSQLYGKNSRRRSNTFGETPNLNLSVVQEEISYTPSQQYKMRKQFNKPGLREDSNIHANEDNVNNRMRREQLRKTKSEYTMIEIQHIKEYEQEITENMSEWDYAPKPPKIRASGNYNNSIGSKTTKTSRIALTAASSDGDEFVGFVTCLNSKNLSKYQVGQPYRNSIVIGMDEEHSKLIVYNKNMARGSLVVLRSQRCSKYEKGYPIQDVKGKVLGVVHAIDRVQNLLVINTSVLEENTTTTTGGGQEINNTNNNSTYQQEQVLLPKLL